MTYNPEQAAKARIVARPRTPAELRHINWLVRTGCYPKATTYSDVAVKIIESEAKGRRKAK